MDFLQNLLTSINLGLEVDERKFPYSDEVYIYTFLRDKFPEENLTLEKVKKLLAEELALKNITLKETSLTERNPSSSLF